MKKVLVIALALMLVTVCVCACSSDSGDSNADATTEVIDETVVDETGDNTEGDTAGTSAGNSEGRVVADGEPMHITLITMDQMDVHWVKLQNAAKEEVEKLQGEGKNIEYEWLAPERKDNAQQIQQIETAINNGADAIIISVNDSTACNDALQQALDQGIRLIYVDAAASLDADATFATDNYAAGVMAGEEMVTRLEEAGLTEGEVGIVSAQAGVQSCIDRVDGFISAFDGSSFTMSEVQYSDGDASKAQELANALINDGCIAVYGANDGATTGAANAVKEANAGGKSIICVGFDNSSSNRALINDGALLAFMAQNPAVMGQDAIEAAVALLSGETLTDTNVDTGVTVVTDANVSEFED